MIAGMDQTAIRSTAAKTAYDYDVSAQTADMQSQMYKASAANVKAAAPMNTASSILGSVSGVASKWNQMSTAGVFSGVKLPDVSNFSFGF